MAHRKKMCVVNFCGLWCKMDKNKAQPNCAIRTRTEIGELQEFGNF